LEALAWRHHPELPSRRVISFPFGFFPLALRRSLTHFATNREVREHHLRVGSWFANKVRKQLRKQSLEAGKDAFFGYSQDSLEVLEYLASKRIFTVVDQIDPAQLEEDLVLKECEKWPGWERFPGRISEEFWLRLKEEWRLASLIVVNSQFSKKALTQAGVPDSKIAIVPLAYESAISPPSGPSNQRPFTVLWLGQVGLRKGIQYLLQAAELLKDHDIQFLVAGSLRVSREKLASAPANVKFLSYVDRSAVSECYAKSHVFALPTIADGFAITQLEAMAHGLPVIATPNCGDVVTDGADGFLVQPGDAAGLANRILALSQDRGMLASMSRQALEKSRQFTVARYGEQLQGAVNKARHVV